MKYLLLLLLPVLVFAQPTATIHDNGNAELTDNNVTYYLTWITPNLLQVKGTDDSCYVLGYTEEGMVQLDCLDLHQVSVLLANLSTVH